MMNCENSSRGDSFIVFMVKKESNDIVLPESLFDFVFLGGGGGGIVDLTYLSMQLCQTGYGDMRQYQHPAITGRNRLYHLD